MDIKLDFVPSSLINFISRQLIGSGFKLYQKVIASVIKSDEDFGKALGDPLYSRIREALYSDYKAKGALEPADLKSDTSILPEENVIKTVQDDMRGMDQMVLVNETATESSPENAPVINWNALGEIEEEEIEVSRELESGRKGIDHSPEEEKIEESRELESDTKGIDSSATNKIEEKCSPTNKTAEKCPVNNKKSLRISSEVEQALQTLEKIISMVREFGFNDQARSPSYFVNEEFPNLEKSAGRNSTSSEDGGSCLDGVADVEASKEDIMERALDEPRNSSGIHNSRHMGSNSYLKEVDHNRIAPASPEQNQPIPSETHQVTLCSSENGTTEAPILDKTTNSDWQTSTEVNGFHENSLKDGKLNRPKKNRLCCLHFIPGH